jgi:Heavy metal associated domain 2
MATPTSARKVEACEPVIGKADDKTDVLSGVASCPASANIYVHHVKGRLRVQATVLSENAAEMQALRQQLGALRGVRKVACNPIIGSITVEYAPELEFPVLLGILQSARIEMSALLAVLNESVSAGYSPWRNLFAAALAR